MSPVITHRSTVLLPTASLGDGNDMIVVDVKYDEYALVHVVDTKGEHLTVVNKLYGESLVSLSQTLITAQCIFFLMAECKGDQLVSWALINNVKYIQI